MQYLCQFLNKIVVQRNSERAISLQIVIEEQTDFILLELFRNVIKNLVLDKDGSKNNFKETERSTTKFHTKVAPFHILIYAS